MIICKVATFCLQIRNKDQLCLARAVTVAKARLESHPKWDAIRKGRNLQEKLAKEIMADAGLTGHVGMCGLSEVEKIQQSLLPEYQIKVYSKDHMDALIYKGEKQT